MKILVDTDVLLDVALDRIPHVTESAAVLRWAEAGGRASVAWHSLTNCSYLLKGSGRSFLELLLKSVSVANVGDADARRALQIPLKDLEDAFQVSAALAFGAEWIVTRNIADYRRSPVPAITPITFLKKIG